jgi:hypothetical protein
MVKYKFLSLCFLILLGSSVMAQKMTSNTKVIGNIVYDAENKGSVTAGNLSIGKFYRFSREPDTTYKDEYPNNWSDGAKLTDEVLNTGPELNTAQYVGWKGTRDLEITVDLGRIQSLEKLNVNGMASVQLNAQEPVGAAVFVKQEKNGKWVLFAKQNFANNKASTGNKPFSIEVGGPAIKARFVKLVLKPSSIGGKSGLILLDELSLLGKIKNTWRSVPAEGCFHGAFPTSVGYSKEELAGRKGMVVDLFEKQVGKQLSMVLWYQGMAKGRDFLEIQKHRENHLTKDYNGVRHLSIGWLPKELKPLATGGYDEFFTKYFKDSVDPAILKGMNDPIWIRPMNEFNGGWVPYGLDPVTFRKAWRRMYNIAEQLGAASHHIFVWSPNYLSFPDKDWNKMEKYYPGDQYVDWVGISSYPPGKKAAKSEDMRYPIENIKEAYEKYAHYKPFMISEGGFSDDIDPVRWVREWFEFKTKRPNVKAVIWENHNDRVIARSAEALELYRKMVQDKYWLAN